MNDLVLKDPDDRYKFKLPAPVAIDGVMQCTEAGKAHYEQLYAETTIHGQLTSEMKFSGDIDGVQSLTLTGPKDAILALIQRLIDTGILDADEVQWFVDQQKEKYGL